MTDQSKITTDHRMRNAVVYIRQSTGTQVEHNRESRERQYQLADRAEALGWSKAAVVVIDEDLGISGSGLAERTGFKRLIAEVALRHVGIVLGLEASRLARNNADWYRLLDLCGATDTLIGDADGIYHPGHINDRLVLGLKGTMSETELHILRARLNGGIRNKAERGELRRGLPVGLVWGEGDGEVRFHPDEAVRDTIQRVFEKFAEFGSARRVWLWFRSEGLRFPSPVGKVSQDEIRWVTPTYTKIHQVLTNPVYAGVYVYGKTKRERYVDEKGAVRTRSRKLPRDQWAVFLRDHHDGYITWETFEANQARLARNIRPKPHASGGPVREGSALLQGIGICGRCGRRLSTHYTGQASSPGYHCAGSTIVNGRGEYCLRVGAGRIDKAVADALLAALTPAGVEAALLAEQQIEDDHDAAVAHWRQQVERVTYEATRAERRYRAVDAENRLVARGLEAEWEERLREVQLTVAELNRREQHCPDVITEKERATLLALGDDLARVWTAPTTTDRDRKELLQTLLEEVILSVDRKAHRAEVTLRWTGGHLDDIEVALDTRRPVTVRTDEETLDLVRRLAQHYPDTVIAGILNRQQRRTARGLRFTANRVASLRKSWKIPCFKASASTPEGDLMSVAQAAKVLEIAPSTLHRWLNVGFIAGEQLTPGAPWRIRMNDAIRRRFVEEMPEGYVPLVDAMRLLRVSKQTVLQRVKRGDLEAVHVRRGRRKGLAIKVPSQSRDLFNDPKEPGGSV